MPVMFRIVSISLCLIGLFSCVTPAEGRSRTKNSPHKNVLTLKKVLSLAAAHPQLIPFEQAISEAEARAIDAGQRGADSASFDLENLGGQAGSERIEATIAYARPLLDSKRVEARRIQARAEVLAAQLSLSAARRRVSLRVQKAFHELAMLERLYRMSCESSDLARKTVSAVKIRLEGGAATENDRLRAEVEQTKTDIVKRRYEGEKAMARASLALALGLTECPEGSPEADISINLTLPAVNILETAMLSSHPDLLDLAQEEIERSALEKSLSVERRRETRLIGGVRAMRENFRTEHTFVAGVETDLPRANANKGALAATQIAGQRIEASKNALIIELKARLREALARFEAARSLAKDFSSRLTPHADNLLEMTLASYSAGKTDLFAVLDARRALAESRIEHLEALRDMFAAADAVETLTGICVSGEAH